VVSWALAVNESVITNNDAHAINRALFIEEPPILITNGDVLIIDVKLIFRHSPSFLI
jgi:hypothetical protein